jgi:DNA-binding NarL/FixJ family response regulator
MVRVVIADDHPLIRLALRKLLDRTADIEVVAEAANGQEAIQKVELLQPDVLILDIHMPVMDGLQALEYLQRRGMPARVIVLSAYKDPIYTSEALSRGAWGYCAKEEAPARLVDTVRRVGQKRGRSPAAQSRVRVFPPIQQEKADTQRTRK